MLRQLPSVSAKREVYQIAFSQGRPNMSNAVGSTRYCRDAALASSYEHSTAFIDSADCMAGKKDCPATQGKPVAHLEI